MTNTISDIEITGQCSKNFDDESKILFKKGEFALAGLTISFLIPIWNQVLVAIFKIEVIRLKHVVLICLMLLLLILTLIGAIYYFREIWSDQVNKRSNKYKIIARDLELINLNLKIKYAK